MNEKVWYRYYAQEFCGGGVYLELECFRVIRHTPKGVQLDLGYASERFVLRSATKRYACPTKTEALESFIAKKRRQIRFLSAELKRTERILDVALSGETQKSAFEFDVEIIAKETIDGF